MKDLTHRLTILALVLVIVALVWKLLKQDSVAATSPSQPRDLFDMANYEKRKQEFSKDSDREVRLGVKSK